MRLDMYVNCQNYAFAAIRCGKNVGNSFVTLVTAGSQSASRSVDRGLMITSLHVASARSHLRVRRHHRPAWPFNAARPPARHTP